MANEKKAGGGQGCVRASFGAGRIVVCSGTAPGGKPCQRARFQSRGIDEPFECGDHRADSGRAGHRPIAPSRRTMRRRWERR